MTLATTPFNKNGLTHVIAASQTPELGKQVPINNPYGGQYYIVNDGDEIVWLCAGSSAEDARDGAQPATVNNKSKAIAIIPGTGSIYSFAETAYFSAYSSAPCNVFIVQGIGS